MNNASVINISVTSTAREICRKRTVDHAIMYYYCRERHSSTVILLNPLKGCAIFQVGNLFRDFYMGNSLENLTAVAAPDSMKSAAFLTNPERSRKDKADEGPIK